MRALLLCCLLACGRPFEPEQRPTTAPRSPATEILRGPDACSLANNEGLWASDCARHCLPDADARPLLCHGNGEAHLWVAPSQPQPPAFFATLEPADVSGCGVPAYRVWALLPDAELATSRAGKDTACFSTWYSLTTHCQDAAQVPKEQQAANFFATHAGDAYLLMPSTEIGWSE